MSRKRGPMVKKIQTHLAAVIFVTDKWIKSEALEKRECFHKKNRHLVV